MVTIEFPGEGASSRIDYWNYAVYCSSCLFPQTILKNTPCPTPTIVINEGTFFRRPYRNVRKYMSNWCLFCTRIHGVNTPGPTSNWIFLGRSPLSQVPPPGFSLPWRIAAPRNLRRAELPAPLLPAASLFLVSVTFLLDEDFLHSLDQICCVEFGMMVDGWLI